MPPVFKEAKLAAINKVEVQALPSRLRGLLSARSRALTYRCWRSDDGVTVTMVSGRNDAELQALGRSHGMPRGFFVLQRDGAADPDSATYGGFYPKFANDHKDEAVSGQRLEEFAEIRVSPKFSGHLGMCTAYRQGSSVRLLFFSKNDASPTNPHVRWVREALGTALQGKPAFVERMADEGITVCAEIIAPGDETHGARVRCQAPWAVVTCIARHAAVPARFVDYLSPVELAALCEAEGLPWSGSWLVSPDWFAKCDAVRDRMTWAGLLQTLPPSQHRFAVDHADLLGDVLEGVVVHCFPEENGRTFTTFKYKLLRYVVRTMALRDTIKHRLPLPAAMARVRDVVRRWAADPQGPDARDVYHRACYAHWLATTATRRDALQCPRDESLHIYAMDAALEDDEGLRDFRERHLKANVITRTVYVVMGPIGSGKSTTAARLAATLGVPHVDGDILLNHSARLFGPERAPATLYAVAAALASHPTAVLSCGGGVLFSDTRVDFRCTLEGALSTPDRPAIVDMVAVLPQRDGMTLSDIFHSHNARAVAAARARRGEVGWEGADDPAFADRVAAASRENLKFAEAARSVADRVCFWRYRPGGVGEVGFGCEGAGVEGLAEAGGAEVDGLSGQLAKVDLRADGVGTCVGAESSCSAVGSDGVPVGSAADGVVPETPQTAAASTAPSLRVLQVRCAALCQGRVRHVTIAYSPTPDIDVDVTSLASFDPCEVSGRIVSRKEGKTTLLCIVPDQSSLPGSALPESWKKVLGIVAAVADFAHRWHVTLSSGALPASRLIDVARAYRSGNDATLEVGPEVTIKLLGNFCVL